MIPPNINTGMKYLILTLMLISGCAVSDVKPSPEPVIFDDFVIRSSILWVMYDNRLDVIAACEALGLKAKAKHRIMACATYSLPTNTCTIYAKIPEFVNDEDTTFLGHEMLHCFIGAFHK